MANILDIRRRIRSVTNTRQITRAMKMVSAARLRRAQERALAARPYAQMLTNVLKSLVSRADIFDPDTGELLHPLLVRRPEQNVLLLIVTGDKGLAGAFNANILKAAMRFIESKSGKNIELETIGRKGRDFMRRRFKTAEPRKADSNASQATTLVGEQVGVLNKIEYSLASDVAERVISRYTHAEIDSVYLVYNEFKSVIAQIPTAQQIIPPVFEQKSADALGGAIYEFEPEAEDILNDLLPRNLAVQIFRALLENAASFYGAQMSAMDNATRNAGDMIRRQTLFYNRTRQAMITKELIEIISGAEAL